MAGFHILNGRWTKGKKSVEVLCRIAAERGLRVDMHCDECDDPLSRHIETLTAETVRHGLQDRVTGSHLTSMHSMDNYYVGKLLPMMVEAEMNVVSNPLINITLQGRHETYPKRRGMTRVPELMGMLAYKGGVWTRLRDGSLVFTWFRRYAGSCKHGAACGANDRR